MCNIYIWCSSCIFQWPVNRDLQYVRVLCGVHILFVHRTCCLTNLDDFINKTKQWGEIWHGGVDLWGKAFISRILGNIFSFGAPSTSTRAPIGRLLHAKFYPSLCNLLPLWGKKAQNRPLSDWNNGAMCYVIIHLYAFSDKLLTTDQLMIGH